MTRNFLLVVLAVVLALAVFLGARFVLTRQSGPTAGLKVTSTPTASLFIDSRNIGRTPFEDRLESGEYTIKLIPESPSEKVISWQTKVKLTHNLLTYINRELGASELTSAGEVLTLEKISARLPELTIHTTPDGASVKLDNVERGNASLTLRGVEAGDHTLEVSAPGFIGRTIKIRTTAGYRLAAVVQLGLGGEPTATTSAEPTSPPTTTEGPKPTVSSKKTTDFSKPYISIRETPTGFLRVRESASTSAKEIGRVKPGEKYAFLEEKNAWYKIRLSADQEGWISSQYGEKVE